MAFRGWDLVCGQSGENPPGPRPCVYNHPLVVSRFLALGKPTPRGVGALDASIAQFDTRADAVFDTRADAVFVFSRYPPLLSLLSAGT
ncbi:hypothetical protein RSAG8_07656, partial [Rhizoctonia solani AG-8 WAC10335]